MSEPRFTEREAQVLKLLVDGHPNRVIADELGIDLATVKKHVGTLMRKVGVKNRIALSVQVVNRNLLSKCSRDGTEDVSREHVIYVVVNKIRSKVYLPSYRCGGRQCLMQIEVQQHRPGRGVVERASGVCPALSLQPPFFLVSVEGCKPSRRYNSAYCRSSISYIVGNRRVVDGYPIGSRNVIGER